MAKKYSVLKLELAVIKDDGIASVFFDDKDVTDELISMMGVDEFESAVGIASSADDKAYDAYVDCKLDKADK